MSLEQKAEKVKVRSTRNGRLIFETISHRPAMSRQETLRVKAHAVDYVVFSFGHSEGALFNLSGDLKGKVKPVRGECNFSSIITRGP